MLPGVRPSIIFASLPTAQRLVVLPFLFMMATTDGSFSTMPRPLTYTSVLAVTEIDGHVAGKHA